MSSDLAQRGRKSYEWARAHMPALLLAERYARSGEKSKALRGLRIAACLHVSKETSVLVRTLAKFGSEVRLVAANPLSSQADIVAFLQEEDVEVNAKRGQTAEEYEKAITELARADPDLIVDDGGELHLAYAEGGGRTCFGGTDETTTGTVRLRALAGKGKLRYPAIPVNEAKTKHYFDNKYGTGQSALDGLVRATGLLIAGKAVVVAGYGWVGSGVALRARGMGARVVVTEVDPIKAVEAYLDGVEVMPMERACKEGDIFLTCTGQIGVLRVEHFRRMKDGALVGNVGHFDREIDVSGLFEVARRAEQTREGVVKFQIGLGRSIYLLNQGRVVNLASAEGHPPEVMQMSFANQLLSLLYLAVNRIPLGRIPARDRVLDFPEELDRLVSSFAVSAFGIELDDLSPRQRRYLASTSRARSSS